MAGLRLAWAGWVAVIGFALATLCAYAATGQDLDLTGIWRILPFLVISASVFLVYRRWRPAPTLSYGVELGLQLYALLVLSMFLSFALADLGGRYPLRDDVLHAADRFLGFDWMSLYRAVMARPWLRLVLSLAYMSFAPQFAVVVVVLIICGRLEALQRFVLAVALTLAMTLALFWVMPALGYHAYFGVPPEPPSAATMLSLRSGALSPIRLSDLDGLVTFPSFHTVGALLFAWAMWSLPRLRWPFLGLNGLLIASTPAIGSHYLVDLLAGGLVAAAGIALANRFAWAPGRMELPSPVSPARR